MKPGEDVSAALRDAVEVLLAADFRNKRLAKAKNQNRISRRHYLRLVRAAVDSRAADPVFDRYEALVDAAMGIDERFLKQLDEYIEQAIDTRTLKTRKGTIVRQRVRHILGLERREIEHVAVATRLDHWDLVISRSSYMQNERAITEEDRRLEKSNLLEDRCSRLPLCPNATERLPLEYD